MSALSLQRPLPQPLNVLDVPQAHLKISTVIALTGMSESTIRRRIADGHFPPPIHHGKRCTRWVARDVATWLEASGQVDRKSTKQ
jgi:prophage regulatory protein